MQDSGGKDLILAVIIDLFYSRGLNADLCHLFANAGNSLFTFVELLVISAGFVTF